MQEQELLRRAQAFLQQNKESIIRDIGTLVAIPSVEGPPAPGAPFGPGPRQALDAALAIARRMGFEPHHHQGYMGWFDLPGRQPQHIATITHLDVVPAGGGWRFDPFRMERRGEWLIGRGTDDDKGPLVYCMYLAKFLRDSGVPLRYTLRTLMGCAEETGMRDVGPYLAAQPQPAFCLSSDALFPVCSGEKGLFEGEWDLPVPGGNVLRLHAGEASNMIPEQAVCWLQGWDPALRLPAGLAVQAEGPLFRLTARGVGAHCAMPERGVSAAGLLLDFLLESGLLSPGERPAFALLQKLHRSFYGEGLGLACRDDIFGPLTCAGGILRVENGLARQNMNIRYPSATGSRRLESELAALAKGVGGDFRLLSASDPFYIPPEDEVLQTLLGAYRAVTQNSAPAYAWGGGTYARCFKRAVSFGPGLPEAEHKPPCVGDCHGPNEGTNLATLDESFLVYALAVFRLQGLTLAQLEGRPE
ncbi:Sapep family Mn(2+)-dependent dipeptidase [Allofournierella sp.]|uniref:Sapep family Mn(2+)-dependent dipeptidase n=1 Tax=Allofournierella sp. TaxID=1940256 RepID=UPI003AB6AE36